MGKYNVVAKYKIDDVFQGEIEKKENGSYSPVFQKQENKWRRAFHDYSTFESAVAFLEGVVIGSFNERFLMNSISEKEGWLEMLRIDNTEEGKTLEEIE